MGKCRPLNKLLTTSIPGVSDFFNASVLKDGLNVKQCKAHHIYSVTVLCMSKDSSSPASGTSP